MATTHKVPRKMIGIPEDLWWAIQERRIAEREKSTERWIENALREAVSGKLLIQDEYTNLPEEKP